jgi:hypothetical protein
MKLRGRILLKSTCPASTGSTLVELLASMGILSVLLLVLGSTLEVALGRFRSGAEQVENEGGARVAVYWMGGDLAAAFTSRPARLPRLPTGTTAVQRTFFEGSVFLPFEINRARGSGMKAARSFQNAATGFDSIVFATERDGDGPAIAGYYVAYARSSPLSGDSAAGMKLFRHYRRGGSQIADGYAGGIISYCSHQINDTWDESRPGKARLAGLENPAAVRRGRFENADLPFLLARRLADLTTMSPVAATQPWPSNPVREWLTAPPPSYQPTRGTASQWADPASPVHDAVFPDEAICDNVVRFELQPRRRVTLDDGTTVLMDAVALNRHLGLSGGDEWPVLVAPDFIEMTIASISEKAALTLTSPEDWVIDFTGPDSGAWSSKRQLIERELQTHRFQLTLPSRAR